MKEKISVIIPAYNLQDYLGATLDSVLAQTYENLEIIVVNDGSKDDTAAVMDAYAAKDSRIRAIHKENGGVTSARLRGVAEATGAYIGFVDGDDYIEPQMYERLMENLKEYGADISHCGYQMVFPSRVDLYYNTGCLVKQDRITGTKDLLSGSMIEPGLCNKLYHKTLFHSLLHDGIIPEDIKINEDLLMNFYLFRQAKVSVFEDVCPYHYVLRKGSAATSRMNEHKLKDPLKVLHRLMDETADVPEWNAVVERRLLYQLINTATLRLSDQKDLIAPVRREARRELRKRLSNTLRSKTVNKKLKIMALWASVWPGSYGWVHAMYARVTGSDRKFEVK